MEIVFTFSGLLGDAETVVEELTNVASALYKKAESGKYNKSVSNFARVEGDMLMRVVAQIEEQIQTVLEG